MKNKLIGILIFSFIIFISFQNTIKAYTWEEFLDYSSQLYNNSATNANIKRACNGIINQQNYLKNLFSNNGINVNNMNSFVVENISNIGWISLNVYSGTTNIAVSGTSYKAPVGKCIRFTPRSI